MPEVPQKFQKSHPGAHPKTTGVEIKSEGKKDQPPDGPKILDGRRGEKGTKILTRRPNG